MDRYEPRSTPLESARSALTGLAMIVFAVFAAAAVLAAAIVAGKFLVWVWQAPLFG